TTTFSYDTTNRVTTVTDPLGIVTKLYYDTAGRLIQKAVDPAGLNLSTSFTYNAMGDVLTVTPPGGNTVTYAYDAGGNRTSDIDAAGDTVARTFNSANQVTAETRYLVAGGSPSSPVTTWFAYDSSSRLRYSITQE